MPNVIHHAHRPPQVHHGVSWYLLIVLGVMLILSLVLTMLPIITSPGTTFNPVLYRESVYREYLRGEKVMYTNPAVLNNALVAYHAGEKIIYDVNSVTWAYHFGEKSAVLDLKALNAEDALFLQRMGEKVIK